MTGSRSPVASRPVQELVIGDGELPERYVYKGNDKETIDGAVPSADIPAVDMGILLSSLPAGKQELDKLRTALETWGCFQAINHGMTSELLDKVRGGAKGFFALPAEEKHRYNRATDGIEGYGNDMILSENQTLDWSDRMYLLVRPEGLKQHKYWPERPADFGENLREYTTKAEQVAEVLLKAMARTLNLDDQAFLDQYGEQAKMFARFNFYPKCPWPDTILGLKPHADGSVITILLQDKEVEGLQVLKGNQWFRVSIIPHALLINVGDQIEIMSNGTFKSPVHRVVTNSEKERLTLAVFCQPEQDREIGPANALITDSTPRLYRNVKNYMAIYFQYYQQGKRPISASKI